MLHTTALAKSSLHVSPAEICWRAGFSPFCSFNPKHSQPSAKCLVKQIKLCDEQNPLSLFLTKAASVWAPPWIKAQSRWRVGKACFSRNYTGWSVSTQTLWTCADIRFCMTNYSISWLVTALIPPKSDCLSDNWICLCKKRRGAVISPGSCRAGRCGTPPHSWAWGCGTLWWALWHVSSEERGSSGPGRRPIRGTKEG